MLPGSGKVKDRTLISEYTGEDPVGLGGFPMNSLDCMVQGQSVNNSWKILLVAYMRRSITFYLVNLSEEGQRFLCAESKFLHIKSAAPLT